MAIQPENKGKNHKKIANIFLDEGDRADIKTMLDTVGARMMPVSICEQVSVGKVKNKLKHFHDIAMVLF